MKSKLTKSQQELLDLFINTPTEAKVIRRHPKKDGSFEFETVVRNTKPIDFPVHPGEFAIKIHQIKPDSPLSPIYVNLRNLPENIIDLIGKVTAEVELDQKFDVSTGIPQAALVMAEKFAEYSKIPYVDIFDKIGTVTDRKIVTKKGAKSGKGKSILIFDDVVSQGKSKYEAIQAAESLGYKVGIIVLIDREQGGAQQMEKDGYPVYSALKIRQIIDHYLETGKITKEQKKKVEEYIKAS